MGFESKPCFFFGAMIGRELFGDSLVGLANCLMFRLQLKQLQDVNKVKVCCMLKEEGGWE